MGGSASVEPTAPRRASRPGADADRSRSTAALIRRGALALFLVQRLASVVVATTPWVSPDEYGAWAIAAALVTGDAPMTMRDTPTYPLASGLVLAPIEVLGLDPVLSYRLALAWLAGLVLGAAWLVRSAIRRLCPGRPVLPDAAFALVLLFPATTVTTAFTWAETAVLVWWAAFLLVSVRALVERSNPWVLGASALVGLAPVVHGRLSLVPLIWLVALVVASARQRSGRPWVAGAVITLVVTAGGLRWQQAVVDRVWEHTQQDRGTLDDLAPPGELAEWLVAAGGGQLWYVIVASAGLAALGVVALTSSARQRSGDATPVVSRDGESVGSNGATFAVVFGASLLSTFAVSALFMTRQLATTSAEVARFGGDRWDHVVYGRYVDAAVLMLAVLGLTRLFADRPTRPRPTVVLVSAGAVATVLAALVGLRARTVDLGDRLELTLAGVTWLPLRSDGLDLLPWTVVGLVLIGALVIAVRRSQRAVLVTLATWLVVGSCLATATAVEHHSQLTRPELVAALGSPVGDVDRVVLPADVEALGLWRLGVFAQQRDLIHRGWRLDFVDRSSASTRTGPAADVGALVLLDDVVPDLTVWAPVAEFGGATLWRRNEG